MSAPLSRKDQRLADAVSAFGCPGSSIVSLRDNQKQLPDHVSYLDLLSDQVQQEVVRLPDAVAEFQGKPVMYLIDAESGEPDLTDRVNLQQRLANRGDHAVLAIVRPGELVLYPLNLDRKTLNEKGLEKTVRIADPRAPFLFHEVATGTLDLGFHITRHLAESFAAPESRAGLGEPSPLSCVIGAANRHCQGLYLSTHQRLFSWPDGRSASPIELYHSWHHC